MYCYKCGTKLPQDAEFCSSCGTKLNDASAMSPLIQSNSQAVPPPLPPLYKTSTPPIPPLSVNKAALMTRPAIVSVLAILQLLSGTVMLLASLGIVIFAEDKTKPVILVAAFVMILVATLQFICGHGLWRLKNYGRIIQLVFSWIGLLGFPLGTIISILILIYLNKPEIKILFSGKTPQQLTNEESQILASVKPQNMGTVAAIVGVAIIVLVAMSGIIAAIAIPNFLNAVQRGKQKRTVSELRIIALACEAYATDYNAYPKTQPIEDLSKVLQPTYIKVLPLVDGWGHPFRYQDLNSQGYVVASTGKDGLLEYEDLGNYMRNTATRSFNNDIVFSNGGFVQYPDYMLTAPPAGNNN